jgi:hypothetical protein
MEGTSKHKPPRLTESTPKHDPTRLYERFLELPVSIVLVVTWVVGAALIGLCTLALYMLWSLLKVLMGA